MIVRDEQTAIGVDLMRQFVVVCLVCSTFVSQMAEANWLYIAISGANLDPSQYAPEPSSALQPSTNGRAHSGYRNSGIVALCNGTFQLNEVQARICARQPYAMPSVSNGARTGLYECQYQFRFERWNCSNLQNNRSDVLGPTLRSNNRESAFLRAVSSAGIVHQVTRGCSGGNLSDCGCDNKIRGVGGGGTTSSATNGDDDNEPKWQWGGCSDNVAYGMRFAEEFLDRHEQQQFATTNNVQHQVNMHNHLVGRMLMQRLMRRQCRCHGVSGSCEFKTCWMQLPNFNLVGDHLKHRYDMYAVRVAKRAKRRLRRKKKSDRKVVISDSELVYVNRSPDYCVTNKTLGVFGTTGRQCNASSLLSDSCDLLCCGRGHNTRIETRTEKCNCKFVWCCYVKCKWCEHKVEVHTCK